MIFLHSLHSEWLKTKRSAAFWLSLIGGFFIPLIHLISHLVKHSYMNEPEAGPNAWQNIFMQQWQNMASFLLPMGVILASSLITQMEYKNNTWKQLHTTPQSFTTVFFAKFSVILLMTLQFFIFFNIGVILSGIVPCLIFDHQLPQQAIPYLFFLKGNIKFFLACMPILAIQFLISLQFRNFMVPIGIGFLGLIGTLIGMTQKYIFLSPYAYGPLAMKLVPRDALIVNVYYSAVINFAVIMAISYFLYLRKREKG